MLVKFANSSKFAGLWPYTLNPKPLKEPLRGTFKEP